MIIQGGVNMLILTNYIFLQTTDCLRRTAVKKREMTLSVIRKIRRSVQVPDVVSDKFYGITLKGLTSTPCFPWLPKLPLRPGSPCSKTNPQNSELKIIRNQAIHSLLQYNCSWYHDGRRILCNSNAPVSGCLLSVMYVLLLKYEFLCNVLRDTGISSFPTIRWICS